MCTEHYSSLAAIASSSRFQCVMYMLFDSAVILGCDIFESPVADVFVSEESLRPLTLLYLVPFDPLFLYFYDAADYSWFKISTVPVGFSSVHLSLLYPALSPSCSSPLSTTNGRQPRCQFHARVVSSAAEIIYCKIDLNNHKVERRGKATEWNCESLLPFSVRSIAEEGLWCIAYSGDIEFFFYIAIES